MAKRLVNIDEKDRDEVIETCERDSIFLRDHNIMDYSLLLSIEQGTFSKQMQLSRNQLRGTE